MAKKKTTSKTGKAAVLEQMRGKLTELGYEDIQEALPLMELDPDEKRYCPLAALDGNDVVVFCWPVGKKLAADTAIQDDGVFNSRLLQGGRIPAFVWVGDGETNYIFDNNRNTSVGELPEKVAWKDVVAKKMSKDRAKRLVEVSQEYARGNWRQVQRQFDQLHEKLYPKGGITSANEAIDEICRLMFLKIHLEHESDYVVKAFKKRLSDVFNSDYIKENGREAVQELKAAFREISGLEQYKTTDQFGDTHGIFPGEDYLRLDRPDILAFAVDIFAHMPRLVTKGRVITPDDNNREDLLGWAYDVFLRGKYDGSGGMATYLTPSQVTEAMTIMALHDIKNDKDLWEGFHGVDDPKSTPAFRMGDFACGTGRFLMKYLDRVRQRIFDSRGYTEEEKTYWFRRIVENGVIGADQSGGSLIKARLNMLLYGGIHTQLLKVEDTIKDQHLDQFIGKMSLIMTNPPFGNNKYDDAEGMRKMRGAKELYNPKVRDLLDDPAFQPELGWKWKDDRSKRKAEDKTDPAVVFLDRNLQMLKPGGRLLIVLPDGILCNSGCQYVRDYLMGAKDAETGEFFGGRAVVRAVVSMPTETFQISGTGAKTSFLYLQKKGPGVKKQGQIFMAVAEHVGYMKKGKAEIPDPMGNDLQPIADSYGKGTRG